MIHLSEAKELWEKFVNKEGWISVTVEDIVESFECNDYDYNKELSDQLYTAYNFYDKEVSADESQFKFTE